MRERTLDHFDERLRELEREAEQRAVFERDWTYAGVRVVASCPPSTSLFMRGGLVHSQLGQYGEDFSGFAWQVPNLEIDLTDPTSVTKDLAFTIANYYRGVNLVLNLPEPLDNPQSDNWTFNLLGYENEYATAAEAEQDLQDWLYIGANPNYAWPDPWGDEPAGMPLVGLILRNNGTVGTGTPILPVDSVNRDRSYIWPTDLRPRWGEAW